MISQPHHAPQLPVGLCGRSRAGLGAADHDQPRTYRLQPSGPQQTAYRRLALAIVGLDVATLADALRLRRRPWLPRAA